MEGLKEDQIRIDISKLTPLIDDTRLLKFSLNMLKVEVKIRDTYPEIANALIRASAVETPHYALDVIYENIYKTDRDINTDLLIQNISLLPLRYGLTDKDIDSINMELNITNNGTDIMQVNAGDILFTGSYKPTSAIFMPTTQLIALGPGKQLRIKNIKVVRGMGIDHARFAVALDTYRCMRMDTNSTITPDLANPDKRDYMLQFEVNCILPNSTNIGQTILHNGCDTILHRLSIIRDIVESRDIMYLRQEKDRLELNVPNETNTIARLLERILITEFTDIKFLSVNIVYNVGMQLVLIADDYYSILIKSIDKCRAIYMVLRES